MSKRGYSIAIAVVSIAIVAVLGFPYAKPYLENAIEGVTAPSVVDPSTPARHPDLFEGIYRAGRALTASTGVGLNYVRYGELVATMATEYEIANDKLTDRVDRDVLADYKRALDSYRAASEIWQLKIHNEVRPRPDVASFLEDQHVSMVNGAVQGSLDDELQRLWSAGRGILEAGNARIHPK